ncbi:MAG: MazG nucleotide pyrophosphohydrolase domain-containing protein [Bacillota bacterium]
MRPRIAILGSFRKHWAGIAATAATFRSLGCEVLSPAGEPVNPNEEFVRLDTDGAATEREIVFGVLAAVDRADAVYFYNPDGYLGASAAVEMGYCLAVGKRFYTLAEPADEGHRAYATGPVATPEEVVADLRAMRFEERLSERASLPALQRYIDEMMQHRGFAGAANLQLMLLMVEEVGELARALRKPVGLKTDPEREAGRGPVQEELADVLIYLLALANGTGTDLAAALKQKEAQNGRRVWRA